jgi:hypothetical protein
MTENARNLVQQFTVSEDGEMFRGDSSIPLHFGKSGGTLIVRGVEYDILLLSSDGEVLEEVDELNLTLPAGSSVELSDDNGQRGFSAYGDTTLTIKATSIKAELVMIAG